MQTEQTFYRELEEQFRGSRAEIKRRFSNYQPYLQFLNRWNSSDEKPKALDLGCGRCEWLEFLIGIGFVAEGVDLDDEMLTSCHKRDLQADKLDALEKIQSVESQSLDLVSSFHLVEHLSFEQWSRLVREAYRVLKPHGLLILETPNPENLSVAANSFYLDPTHQTPIPPDLMAFTARFSGFESQKILRLQEDKKRQTEEFSLLSTVIQGVSPDYAMIAQPRQVKESQWSNLMEQPVGFSLNQALADFDHFHLRSKMRYEHQIGTLKEKIQYLQNEIQDLQNEIQNLQIQNERDEQTIYQITDRLESVETKMSFIRRPWTWVSHKKKQKIFTSLWQENFFKNTLIKVKRTFKRGVQLGLAKSKTYLQRSPYLKSKIRQVLKPFPKLTNRLLKLSLTVENQDLNSERLVIGKTGLRYQKRLEKFNKDVSRN